LPLVPTADRMRALMGYRFVLLASFAVLGIVLGGCGKEIGDACTLSSDCSPNGDRLCDPDPSSPNGYCTVLGCDYSTCPDEAACIRFFTGNFTNKPCTAQNSASVCSLDELCSVSGNCVPRSSEVRYCMLKCDSDGDCRDGYECRTFELMQAHGGEPLLSPGTPVDADHSPKFCAVRPPS
jgi:hypothetical protein